MANVLGAIGSAARSIGGRMGGGPRPSVPRPMGGLGPEGGIGGGFGGMPQMPEVKPSIVAPVSEIPSTPRVDTGPDRAAEIDAARQAAGDVGKVLEGMAARNIPPPLSSLGTPPGGEVQGGVPPQGPAAEGSASQQQAGGGAKPEAASPPAEVTGTPAEGMDKDPRYEQIRQELVQKWEAAHPGKDMLSAEGQDYNFGNPADRSASTLNQDAQAVFRERYPDDARGYDEKERVRIYENPRDDSAYQQMEVNASIWGTKDAAEVQAAINSGSKLYNSQDIDRAWARGRLRAINDFVSRYPEKAARYAEKDEGIRTALERQQAQAVAAEKIGEASQQQMEGGPKPEEEGAAAEAGEGAQEPPVAVPTEEGAQVPVEQGAAAAGAAEAQIAAEQRLSPEQQIEALRKEIADLRNVNKEIVKFLAQQSFDKERKIWQDILQALMIAGAVTAQEAVGLGWKEVGGG